MDRRERTDPSDRLSRGVRGSRGGCGDRSGRGYVGARNGGQWLLGATPRYYQAEYPATGKQRRGGGVSIAYCTYIGPRLDHRAIDNWGCSQDLRKKTVDALLPPIGPTSLQPAIEDCIAGYGYAIQPGEITRGSTLARRSTEVPLMSQAIA